MHQICHAVYQKSITAQLPTWLRRKSRAPSAERLDATLILLRLDLDSLHSFLRSLYAPTSRGRPPCDPVGVREQGVRVGLLRRRKLAWQEFGQLGNGGV